MTVRGIDVWGHHLNLIAYAFAPFYRWLGAGPEFLYVVQNVVARPRRAARLPDRQATRFGGRPRWAPYVGLAFAVAYLMYAPIQFIAWINFHPEALVITPFLFAWYFAMLRRWGWFFAFVVLALVDARGHRARRDHARHRAAGRQPPQRHRAGATRRWRWRRSPSASSGTSSRRSVIIRHFNDGEPALLPRASSTGSTAAASPASCATSLRHPELGGPRRHPARPHPLLPRPHRCRSGWLPLASPLHLLMAAPQMLASVIGGSAVRPPDPLPVHVGDDRPDRDRRDRGRPQRVAAVPGRCASGSCRGCSCAPTSPTWPGRRRRSAIATACGRADNPRAETMHEAVELVPDDAAVTSSFNFGPHLSHREQSTTGRTRSGRRTGATRRLASRTARASRVPPSSSTSCSTAACSPVTPTRRRSSTALVAPGGQFEPILDERRRARRPPGRARSRRRGRCRSTAPARSSTRCCSTASSRRRNRSAPPAGDVPPGRRPRLPRCRRRPRRRRQVADDHARSRSRRRTVQQSVSG